MVDHVPSKSAASEPCAHITALAGDAINIEQRRATLVSAVRAALGHSASRSLDLEALLDKAGLDLDAVAAVFAEPGDVLVAVAADMVTDVDAPLRRITDGREPSWDLRATLIDFAERLASAYAGTLATLMRVAISESLLNADIKERLYRAGPGAMVEDLRRFLDCAQAAGKIAVRHLDLAADALIGLLRDGVYHALMLHDEARPPSAQCRSADMVDTFLHGVSGVRENRS